MTEEKKDIQIKDVKDILGLMNRVNETFAYEVWIPSLNKNVMFRELNTSQQKRLIKSVIDSPIYNTEFIFAITQIIKENCADSSVNVEELTAMDKIFICLKMRAISVNDTYEMTFKGFGKEYKRGISLTKVYDDAKEKIDTEKLVEKIFSSSAYEIHCGLPTLKTEYNLETQLRNVHSQEVNRTPEGLRKVIGEVFINELLRHIRGITIKAEEQDIKIDFNDDLTYQNRISIIEQIPVKLLDQVLTYIKSVKKEIEQVNIIETELKEGDKVENVKEVLTIDGSFFINS